MAEKVKYGLLAEASRARRERLIARLVPGQRLRLVLHRNHPRRYKGVRVVLPGHVKGDGLHQWILAGDDYRIQ